VESLTDEIEAGVWEYLERIDRLGGTVAAIEQQYFQKEIAQEAYRYQKEIESGERIVVGVNRFTEEIETALPLHKADVRIEQRQKARLATLKQRRDNAAVAKALLALSEAATANENLMPSLIEAALKRATLGEMADCLRRVWGEYHEAL
jgi:methylmalonyl-CoA mutase, N-terminal domain